MRGVPLGARGAVCPLRSYTKKKNIVSIEIKHENATAKTINPLENVLVRILRTAN